MLYEVITTKEAQLRAILRISKLRYGPENKDYFWINDMTPRILMHPYRQDLTNKDVTNFKDPKGKRLFFKMVQLVKKDGAGYVNYMWQWKDDPSKIVPKISFVKKFDPWGWIIGSGVYINDVHRITSYNVCYTKLLRDFIKEIQHRFITNDLLH